MWLRGFSMASVRHLTVAGLLVLAACGGDETTTSTSAPTSQPVPVLTGPVVIPNQGGSMEGHTPRGFAGSGTGLFAGDNLNAGFPDGEGIQLFISFDLPAGIVAVDGAVIESNALTVSGTPFADLGELVIEPVTYDVFGPSLFDISPDGSAAVCERVGDSGVRCDVEAGTSDALTSDGGRLQYRIFFERRGDSDGSQDLATFFLTDSNTNEPGIFTLTLNASPG